ncbi:MAG: ribbon-helix-helix protein, CopG family [Candidatus Hatepunaea meridiana]|nr:ribbon-helix-helix protein, CopG family [Candidatus Hatepunaea meridiana]
MKAKTFTLSLPDELAYKVAQVAKEESRTRSELFREAIRNYLDKREFAKLSRQAALEAIKRGINTEDDVDQLIHQFRVESVNP